MKILFIGGINRYRIPRGGEEYKNQILIKKLQNAVIIDTHQWKFNPIIWFMLVFNLFFRDWKSVVLSTSSLSTYRLIRVISIFRPSLLSTITYFVIGGFFSEGIKSGVYDWRVYKNLKNIFVEGELLRSTIQLYSEINSVHVVPNFKDFPAVYNFRSITNSVFSFVYVGRINNSKGIGEILRAAEHLCSGGLNFIIHFFGPIEGDFDFSGTNVSYRGFLNILDRGVESYELLSNYDCLLFPTYWYGEGFPGVVIDAFISGLPVIGSRWNMNTELIVHGENGYIVEPMNYLDLAEKMKLAMNSEGELNKMRFRNLGLAQKYHIDYIWPQIEKRL